MTCAPLLLPFATVTMRMGTGLTSLGPIVAMARIKVADRRVISRRICWSRCDKTLLLISTDQFSAQSLRLTARVGGVTGQRSLESPSTVVLTPSAAV